MVFPSFSDVKQQFTGYNGWFPRHFLAADFGGSGRNGGAKPGGEEEQQT